MTNSKKILYFEEYFKRNIFGENQSILLFVTIFCFCFVFTRTVLLVDDDQVVANCTIHGPVMSVPRSTNEISYLDLDFYYYLVVETIISM